MPSFDRILEDLDDDARARFAATFLERYTSGGFGRMGKRDIDVLVFHLLSQLHPDFARRSDTELARQLGTTPTRVRGWRTDARYLYWGAEEQNTLVRNTVFDLIAHDAYLLDDGQVVLEIHDAFVKQLVIDILRRHRQVHDTSFNSALLRIGSDGFWALAVEVLSDRHHEVLDADPRFREATGRQGRVEAWRALARHKMGELGDDLGKSTLKDTAKWMLTAGALTL